MYMYPYSLSPPFLILPSPEIKALKEHAAALESEAKKGDPSKAFAAFSGMKGGEWSLVLEGGNIRC
jgi:hypothetical protein